VDQGGSGMGDGGEDVLTLTLTVTLNHPNFMMLTQKFIRNRFEMSRKYNYATIVSIFIA
jgi:hypothetical protein